MMDDRERQHLQTLYRALDAATVTLAGGPVSPERAEAALQVLEGINARVGALLRNDGAFHGDLAVEFAKLEGQVARVVVNTLSGCEDASDVTKDVSNQVG